MAILSDIGRLISSSLNIDEVYESFATQVQKLIPTDRLSIDLNNPDKQTFTVAYVSGYDIPGRRPGDIVPTAGTITENIRVTRTGMLIHTMGVEDITGRLPNVTNVATVLARMRSLMSVPLISRDEVIGALHFRSKRTNAYTEKDLQLAERIGTQIAAVIANARLYSSLQESEKFLRMSEGRYRTLFNKARDGILLVNRKTGELLDCNQALCDMVERTKKELIGQAQSILNPQQVPVDGQSLGFRVHGSGNPGFVGEDILLSKNEKQIPVEISAPAPRSGARIVLWRSFAISPSVSW